MRITDVAVALDVDVEEVEVNVEECGRNKGIDLRVS